MVYSSPYPSFYIFRLIRLTYNDARKHLTIDRKHTLDLIDTLQRYIEQHTRGLNRLQENFDATTDKAFRKPTPRGGYYKYLNDNVRSFATSGTNAYGNMKAILFIVLDVPRNGTVRFNGIFIGEDDGDLKLIESSMKMILNNQRILNAILSLSSNRRDLDDKLNQIGEELVQISNMIENGSYTTKAKCCPTFLRMLEDILF